MESHQPSNREGLRQRPRQWQAEMFRTVVEVSPNAMVMVDAEGRIEFANARTEQMFGYGPQELVGEPVEILVPVRFRDAHPRYLRGYFQAPEQRAMGAGRDLFAQRRDGTEFPVEIGLNPIDGSSNKSSRPRLIKARPTANICCSPPDRVPLD